MTEDNFTPIKCRDIKTLHGTIESMDAMSQEGFSEIAAIATLALLALEHPSGYRHSENIPLALRAICSKAKDIENCINGTAEEVGCHHIDNSMYRRYGAFLAADKQRTAPEVEK